MASVSGGAEAAPPSVVPCLAGTPNAYSIVIGQGVLDKLGRDIATRGSGIPAAQSIIIITDENVWRWHGLRLLDSLTRAGVPTPLLYILPPGEGSKTREVKEEIEDFMLAKRCLRDTLVIAFGGGVVGDLAGFVAATFMRGVPVVQVPTTLLAAADSSIGGKTAIDTPGGKNLVGAFHQPSGVYIDLRVLESLPVRELANGMAEIIKAGAIADAALFELCERHADAILGREVAATATVDPATGCYTGWALSGASAPAAATAAAAAAAGATVPVRLRSLDLGLLQRALEASVAVKARVVSTDEREGGLRGILNFGHTVGHGIEAVLQPALLHGECVAIGMVKEAEAARALGVATSSLVGRVKRCCKAYGLPVAVPDATAAGPGLAAAVSFMLGDKKNAKGGGGAVTVKCVLLSGIGRVHTPPFTHAVPLPLLHRLLSAAVEVTPLPAPTPAPAPLRIRVPGSKSVSNRAMLLAGVAAGRTVLRGLLTSDDTEVMMAALTAVGARLAWDPTDPTALVVDGNGGAFCAPTAPVYVANAGTASRFLAAMFCVLPLPAGARPLVLCGNSRMHARPIGPLVDALREQGAVVAYGGSDGCLPLHISAGIDPGHDSRSHGGRMGGGAAALAAAEEGVGATRRVVFLEGKVSSQYVSAVLMAAPYFPPFQPDGAAPAAIASGGAAVEFVELRLAEEHPTSLPYIDMTRTVMASFGISVQRLADNRYLIPLGPYKAAAGGVYEVEADASSASYPAAAAALTGRTVILEGVGRNSTQGDAGFPFLLNRMGCTVVQREDETLVTGPEPGPDPGQGLIGIDVDMADQTDCFMTLAVVAAAANGTTRITGIANQRVKECNRIAAMVAEFTKCGVVARELPDGLEIFGCGLRGPLPAPQGPSFHGTRIHCYDDHRIAMSFATLGLCCPMGTPPMVLDDQKCVEKTFPEFWDALQSSFACTVTAPTVDASAPGATHSGSSAARNTVVIVGMRGAGKSGLARAAAGALGIPVVDLDDELLLEFAWGEIEALPRPARSETGAPDAPSTVAGIVAAFGWDAFRAAEVELLARRVGPGAASAAGGRCIVSCGGGIVEAEAARGLLLAHRAAGGTVIEVRRSIADISSDLAAAAASTAGAGDAGRPAYAGGKTLEETYERRRAWYASVSSRVFAVPAGDRDWPHHRRAFTSAVRVALDGPAWRPEHLVGVAGGDAGRSWPLTPEAALSGAGCIDGTAFVCLALPSLLELAGPAAAAAGVWSAAAEAEAAERLRAVVAGCDAVELRVDCLEACGSEDAVLGELSRLRKLLSLAALGVADSPSDAPVQAPPVAPLPVIFTVRTAAEGGRFRGSAAEYAALLTLGARAGAEIIDVELGRGALSPDAAARLVAAIEGAGATVLPSAHWIAAPPPPERVIAAALAAAVTAAPRAPAIKLVAAAAHPADAAAFQAAVRAARGGLRVQRGVSPPVIAIAMGAAGQLSRVSNDVLTPVTHARLPIAAAPGQLSLDAVRSLRVAGGLLRPRAYLLFGSPVAASLSPALHNAGFAALGLPHAYGLVDTADAALAVAVLRGSVAPSLTPPLLPGDARPGGLPPFVGGGNVTIPLKQDILPLLDCLSASAKAIGAVNVVTCVPLPGGGVRLCGDNTDWQGIFWPVLRLLKPQQPPAAAGSTPPTRVALIVGAGGTAQAAAYAARRLGLRPLCWNRTASKAEALAARFGGVAVASLDDEGAVVAALGGPFTLAAVLSTLPPAAAFVPPPWVLSAAPVVLDAVYTGETPLLRAAAAAGCATVAGAEMLVAQGLHAFATWVGRAEACACDGSDAGGAAPPPALPACVPAAAMAAAVAASLAARASS